MEKAGCEALFVGTGGVVGAYTGLADVGTATMTECVTIAGWIADSVSIPVIMDGDTGHGGIMAVRRDRRSGFSGLDTTRFLRTAQRIVTTAAKTTIRTDNQKFIFWLNWQRTRLCLEILNEEQIWLDDSHSEQHHALQWPATIQRVAS